MQKEYSLALWWWAARWFCHIWVIKYIEEYDIKIKEIAWTSIWAIIWACFAIWKKSEEIKAIWKSINFLKLIDLDLRKWVVAWNKVYGILQSIFWDLNIEDTKIPLKILSTNLETWEKIVFTSWKIVDAVRASLSLPMIFTSFEYNWISFIDWWLKSNLPVLDLDWENIIAVSAIRDQGKIIETKRKIFNFEFRKWFFSYNYGILKKTITILMWTNEDLSLELARKNWKNILLISPMIWNYEYYDFNKIDDISEKWYEEMKNHSF